METRNSKHTERRKSRKITAGVIAALLVVVMGLSTVAYAAGGGDLMRAVASLFGLNSGVETYSVENANTVVDPDTTNDWTKYTRPDGSPSTQNVGRIWTDKSVFNDTYTFSGSASLDGQSIQKGDSDFLVGLSALSSMSNLKEMVQTGKPLDIVLVMDVSGSMEDSLVSYEAVYDLETGWGAPNYYILVDGDYQEIEHDNRGWYYETGYGMWAERHDVTPKTSADDQNGTQVYVRNNTAKIDALKNAVNGFIDATSNANAAIDDSNNKHRIALVKFADDSFHYTIGNNRGAGGDSRYNYTQVLSDFSTDANDLKNDVNSIREGGATAADYGMTMAQHVLDGGRYSASGGWFDNNEGSGTYVGARDNAQKVVIFFTDGEPNHSSNWSGSVANDAIDVARELKQSGTLVYSVGVFEDADPSDTNGNFNRYMHGVSSNYPNAQAYNNLGQRTPDSDYYKAASSADELNTIFEDIFEETQEGVASGSPIEENTQQGNTQPGTLTFTDQLGAYMQVTGTGAGADKIQLAYGDTIYTSDSKTTDGNIDTYHFSGQVEGNAVYGAANLADLVVTVERSNDPAVGDKVTVQLPASLLPMRNYDVDTDNRTMTVAEAYPVRLFYGVSLKAEAAEALNDPTSDVYAAIMGSQKSEDGKTVDFYTNSFVKGAADGSATASFDPNAGNKFYYYTQDTPLYIDEGCGTEANEWNSRGADTLYWKDTYWVQTENGGAEERTAGVAVNRGTAEWEAMESTGGYDGTYYIPAGTPRSDRPATLTSAKTNNATGTATNVLNPAWAGTSVNQHLGNNGKLSFDMPGSLEIKKTVDWGNASDQTKQDKNSFTFKVSLTDEEGTALTGEYPYYIDGASDQAGTVENGGTITINGGQSVKIEGLPAGTQFTVEEQGANQNGFTTTDASTAEGNDDTSDGTVAGEIVGGGNVSTTFTNTYKAADVNLSTKTTLKVKKDLQDRGWRDTDEFTFEIDGLGNTAGPGITTPEPADTTITVNSQTTDYTASFGDITFTAPGEYRYNITEDNDTNPIAGIDYSGAIYRVVVTVTDNGTGSLEVSNVAIEQRTNDDGVENNPAVAVQGDTVTFVNKYDADGGTTNIDGTKSYTDATGGNPIDADKFTFKIEALGGYDTSNPQTSPYTYGVDETPLPAGSDEATHSKTVYNTGYDFTFGTIAFDGGDIGRTYEYKVTELAQNKDGQAEDGMTYDTKEYTVKVAVTEVTDGNDAHIVATPDIAPEDLVFTNKYEPTDVTLGENGVAPIQGTKTLDGRDMKDGETFYFQLTQTGGPAVDGGGFVTVLNQPETVTVGKDNMQSGSADFKFSNLTFSQVGIYTFAVNEVADEQGTETADGSGMTYDTNVAEVTVVVSDNHDGTLKAEVTYQNDKHADTTDKALFANTYEASMNYGAEGEGGINVTKQMLDRPMANNEFSFTIAGTDSSTVKADEANAKLADVDKSFQNTAAAENSTDTMTKLQNVSFDQDDAGKTFSYLVSETVPADGDKLVNVAYDQSQYRVDIEVVDNGDGTMHTVTTVTKIKASDGTEVSEVVVDHANSDAQDYAAPTFGFVNDYNPNPATVGENADHQIQVTKYVTGADSATDYTFTLTATGNNIGNIEGLDQNNQLTVSTDGTIKNGESQTKTFGELTFTEPGTYTFTVQENQPDEDAGWTFDDADDDGATDAHTVTVYVTDRNEDGQYDGNLYIDRVTGSPVEITNSYKADSVIVGGEGAEQQITVQKSVTGADSTADFQFKIEPVDPDNDKWKNVEAVDENFDALTSITDDFGDGDSKTAAFSGIKFNAAGEYQFKITEVQPENVPGGWSYDTHEATAIVTVRDNGEGQLEASISYDNSKAANDADKNVQNAAAFTNSYNASGSLDGDADGNLTVTKNYTSNLGSPWTSGDSFGFVLAADMADDETQTAVNNGWIELPDNAGTADAAGITITDKTENYQASFGDIVFKHAGTYKFTVHEVLPDGVTADSPTKDGVTYDTSTKTVTVNVVDNGDGTLTATVAEGSDDLTFTNTYNVQPAMFRAAYFALQGNKVLDGRNWEQGDTFTFTMTAGRGTNPDGTQMADGVVEATMPDKTTDTIEPLADGSKVTDNSAQFTFTDERYPGGDVVPDANDVFTFTQPGTYRYLIAETNPNASKPGSGILGVTYDQTQYRLTVEVKDDGNGNLVVESSKFSSRPTAGSGEWTDIASDQGITFTNKYSANEVGVSFNAAKVLNGRDTAMSDNEFTFHMAFAGWMSNDDFDVQSDNWSMDGEVADKAPAAAADKSNIIRGDVIFDNVTFTSDNVGYTYRYAITEIIPEDATNAAYAGVAYKDASAEQKAAAGWTKDGVTYDGTTKYVTAKVTSEQTEDQQNPGTYIEVVRVATGGEAPYNEQTGQFEGGAIFTNIYAPSSAALSGAKNLEVEKELIGRDWIGISDDKKLGDKYTFTLKAGDKTTQQAVDAGEVILPGETTIEITADTSEHKAAFGDITFTKKGTYTFTVTESGNVPGVTNDKNAERTIVVKVTDNNDGTLTAEVAAGESENLKFTNTYDPEKVTLADDSALKVQKTLSGREWKEGEEYSFTIKNTSAPEGVDAEAIPMPNETVINISKPADGNVNTAVFGDMTFSQTGEYVYEITEVIPDAEEEGMIYDQYHVTVTIIVAEDQTAGEFTAHVTYDNGDQKDDTAERNNSDDEFVTDAAAFTNVKSVETTYNLAGTKVIEGRNFQEEDAFTFELRAVDKAPLPKDGEGNDVTRVTIDQSNVREDAADKADISFGEITFTEPGQYVYKISEIEPEEADRIEGMTYDTAERSVIIEVTADAQGNMAAEMIEPADSLVWTNTWAEDIEPVLSGLTGTKNLTGTAMAEGQFTFLIKPQGDAPMGDSMMAAFNGEVTQNEDGSYTAPISLLNNVTYTENGDYVYIISEVDDGQKGITYDTTKYRVTVHVEGGNVTTKIESTTDEEITEDTEWTAADEIVFNNSYTTELKYNTEGGLSIIKNLKGHDIAAGQFGFTVKAADDASREKAGFTEMSQNYATSASRMNGNGVSTDSMSVFGDIEFTQADAGKTYTYTISETTGGNTDAGYTNDTRTYTVEIITSDDGKGSLTVTTRVTSDQGDEATYTYSNKTGAEQPAVVTFDNTYEASGEIGGEDEVSIIAKKELANSTLNGDDFTFTITDEAGKEVARGTNDASGTITFSEIGYTKDSLIADVAGGTAVYAQVDGKDTYTYQYTVAETGAMPEGVSQVAASFLIQVTVTDNNGGTLTAAVTYPEGSEDGLVFRNVYGSEAEAKINVAGKKILNVESGDNVPDITHKYRFTITGVDEDGNQAPLPGNTTAANDATGSVIFGDIVYTMENVFGNDPAAEDTEATGETSGEATEAETDVQTDDAQIDEAAGAVSEETDNTADYARGAERTKTFYYTVTEEGSVAGVTNDPDDKTFTVTVKDNGDGTLSVESSATAGAQFEFVNTYSVDPTDPESPTDPDAEGGVTITKVLEGRDLKEGEFQFEMTGIGGTISEGMSVSGQNDAEGNVVLGGLVFEAPGTYEFNISEVIPDTLLGGVTYDGYIYTAVADVKDNGDGTLSIAWTVSDGIENVDQITFTNTYKAESAGNVILQATKKLEGRDLKDGEFTFHLKDENGDVISEAANTVNGSVKFDALSFDKAGTYNYTVSEVRGNDDTITYDDTVYNVTVTVTDDLQGHLVATVTGEDGNELNMTFNNKYTKPAEPQDPEEPKDDETKPDDNTPSADGTSKPVQTGDTTPIIPAVIAVIVSLAAIAAVVVMIMRRRRR